MTKQDFQKELLEKVKLGTKPSQLKRSKSASDLPKNLQPIETSRRKSLEVLTNPNSLKNQLEKSQDQIATLELKLEVQERELTELNNLTKENSHLKEQAKIKQQQMESLKNELTQTKQELDKSLVARHQGLKDWNQERVKRVQAEKESSDMVEESSEELINSDKVISDLRLENFKLKQTNQSLVRDLNLSSRLAEMRKVPYFENEFNHSLNYFKYGIYALLAVWFCLILKGKNNV